MPQGMGGPAQSRIFLGVLFALIGVGLQAMGFVISFLPASGSVRTINEFVARMGIQTVIQASGIALLGFGLFLLFFSVAQVRPATGPWTLGAAIVLLVTGLVTALFRVLYFQTFSTLLSGNPSTEIALRLGTIYAVEAAAGYAGLIGTIVGLFGLTRHFVST